jgi:CHAT domain
MIQLPACRRDGRDCPPEFLGQRYQVTRWIEKFHPPPKIRLRKLLYAAPGYEVGHRLLCAEEEVKFLNGLPELLRTRLPASKAEIVRELHAGKFDVFHFVGHASQAEGDIDYSTLELEKLVVETPNTEPGLGHKFDQVLRTENLDGLEDVWTRRPLIFLNACQTGRQDTGLVRPGGWANAVLRSRAGAFIGTLWSVRDRAAFLFSKTFYEALLAGKTIGESSLAARRAVAATGDPSWLAYVVYAHPNARVVVEAPASGGTVPQPS